MTRSAGVRVCPAPRAGRSLRASCLRLPPTPAVGAWATPHGCISVASQVEGAPGRNSPECKRRDSGHLGEPGQDCRFTVSYGSAWMTRSASTRSPPIGIGGFYGHAKADARGGRLLPSSATAGWRPDRRPGPAPRRRRHRAQPGPAPSPPAQLPRPDPSRSSIPAPPFLPHPRPGT